MSKTDEWTVTLRLQVPKDSASPATWRWQQLLHREVGVISVKKELSRDTRDWLSPGDQIAFDIAVNALTNPRGVSSEVLSTADVMRCYYIDVARAKFVKAGGVL